jgi:hypothetical protein
MNQLQLIRKEQHEKFLLEQRKEELMNILKNKLEFDEFKRKLYILTGFFRKYYINKNKKSVFISLQNQTLDNIPGFRRKHLTYKRKKIVFDILEYPLIKDKYISKKNKKKCLEDYKRQNNIIYCQNFEFYKCIYLDCKRNISLINNPSIINLITNYVPL